MHTINIHSSDDMFLLECDLPPGGGVVATDEAGVPVAVYSHSGVVGFGVLSRPGVIVHSSLRYYV